MIISATKLFSTCLIISASFLITVSNLDWKLKKEKDGIKVYTRDRSGSNLKDIKVTCTYSSSLSAFIYVLSKKDEYPEWIYSCSESEVLKVISPLESYHYQVTDAPWPVDDRDLIIHQKITQHSNGTVEIIASGKPDFIPEKRKRVRVPDYNAHWKISPEGKNLLSVEYTISLDPGGSIPDWIINLGVTEGPFNTMQNLKERLPQYQDKKVSYINEVF